MESRTRNTFGMTFSLLHSYLLLLHSYFCILPSSSCTECVPRNLRASFWSFNQRGNLGRTQSAEKWV
jgi:hypothetical protein